MKKPIVDNLFAFSSSMAFHLAIIAVFVVGLGFVSQPEKLGNNKKVNIVHATALNEQQVKQEMNKLALADKNKRDKEKARQQVAEDKLKQAEQQQQKAETAKQQALAEQKQAEVAKQKALDEQKQAELAKQKILAEQQKAEAAKQQALAEQKQAEVAQQKALDAQKQLEAKQKAEAAAIALAAKKKAEQDKKRKAAAKKKAEQDKKRKAEMKRKADLAAQHKKEQEDLSKEAENDAKQAKAAAQSQRVKGETKKYKLYIQQQLNRNWTRPPGMKSVKGLQTTLHVTLLAGGFVKTVEVVKTSGNPVFDRSATNAVNKASQLMVPPDAEEASKFKDFTFIFKPEE